MLDLNAIAYVCFAAVPLLTCFVNTLYYLINSLLSTRYSSDDKKWYMTRPLLNKFFSYPFRKLRNLIEYPFNKLDMLFTEKQHQAMEKFLADPYSRKGKKHKKTAELWEKGSIFVDYFVLLAGELVLLLFLALCMHFFVPELMAEFRVSFDTLQVQITEISSLRLLSDLSLVWKTVFDFFKKVVALYDITSLRWIVFTIITLFLAAPIRVFAIYENKYSPKQIGEVLKAVISHYFNALITCFVSVQSVIALTSLLVSWLGRFNLVNVDATTAYITHICIYFMGVYMIAILAQFFIYTLDLILASISLPFRVVRGKQDAKHYRLL